MEMSISRISLFPYVPLEFSPCSLDVLPCMGGELAKGKEKSMGLPSSCSSLPALVKVFAPIGFSEFSLSCPEVGASSPVLINTPFFFSDFEVPWSLLSVRAEMPKELLLLFPNLPLLQPSSIRLLLLLGEGLILFCFRHDTS